MKVLLVEDGIVSQRVAAGWLQRMGHHVDIAENGLEAVNAWKEKDFDVILMDWHMPVMDGNEATRVIRSEEKTSGKHTPIIAMTSSATERDRELCLQAGMDDYVTKPIDPELLSAILASLRVTRSDSILSEPHSGKTEDQDSLDDLSRPHGRENLSYEIIDIEYAKARTGGGDHTVLGEVANVLLKETTQRFEQIDNALLRGDGVALARAAHALKGAASVFRSTSVVDAAEHIETLGRDNRIDEASETMSTLRQHATRLRRELKHFLASSDALQ